MYTTVKKLYQHKFINATFWIFLAMGVTNVGNYLYHFLMISLLKSPKAFGELEAAISLFFLISVPLSTTSLVIVKFISEAKGRGNKEELASLYYFFQKWLLIIGLIVTVILLLISPLLTYFLHLSSVTIGLIMGFNFLGSILIVFGKSVLQGFTDFLGLALSNFVESATKLMTAVGLVILGYGVAGAFVSLGVSSILGYVIAIVYLRRQKFVRSAMPINYKKIVSYAIPLFISSLAMTSLISSDVVLVRHFFPGSESGYYSFLGVLGKIIFFAVSPITSVMFPMISEHQARGEKYSQYLFATLGLTTLGVLIVTSIYFLFPEFIIDFFPKQGYLGISPLLGIFGLVVGIYAIASVLSNFYFSIHKTSCSFIIVLAAVLQVILIYTFHGSIRQVIYDSLIAMAVLLVGFLLYYPYATKK